MNTLFLSMSRFPEGSSADVTRLKFILKLFMENGDKIYVISRGESTNFEEKMWNGVAYRSFRRQSNNILAKILDILMYTHYLKKYILTLEEKWGRIVVHGVPNKTLKYIKKYTNKLGIQLYYDCVEWYSKEEFRWGSLSIGYRDRNELINKLLDKQVRVIAISTYLETYFKHKGIDTVRIPVILDTKEEIVHEKIFVNKIIFAYAGSPGKKDYLNVILDGFYLLSEEERNKIEFRIIGVSWEWIQKSYHYSQEKIKELKEFAIAYGRLERNETITCLKEASFTVLLRPEELRYAKAGFPTKVVESLNLGIPVVCNLTSDLGMYIEDDYCGKIVENCDATMFSKTIKNILQMDRDVMMKMQKNAKQVACREFDYRKYVKVISEFVKTGD